MLFTPTAVQVRSNCSLCVATWNIHNCSTVRVENLVGVSTKEACFVGGSPAEMFNAAELNSKVASTVVEHG